MSSIRNLIFNFPKKPQTESKNSEPLCLSNTNNKWPLEKAMPSGFQPQNKRAIMSRLGRKGEENMLAPDCPHKS